MTTYQIAYTSVSKEVLDLEMLYKILSASQENNARDGITGILMYHGYLFFQILEGEKSMIEACYNRIKTDPRHFTVSTKFADFTEGRLFPEWAMGYAGPDEIGKYTKNALASLESLELANGAEKKQSNNGLILAYQAYQDIARENKSGNRN